MRTILLLLLSMLIAAPIVAAPAAWSRQLGELAEVTDVIPASGGGVLVAYTSVPCGSFTGPKNETLVNRMVVAKINPDGTEAFSAELPWPEEETKTRGARLGRIAAIARASSGDLFAVVDYRPGAPWLLRLTADGRLQSMRLLSGGGDVLSISDLIATDDGLYLLGTSDGDLFVAKMTEPGQTMWKRVVNLGAFESVSDATATADGGVTVVVNSGQPTIRRTNGKVILLGFDAAGALTAKYETAGRYGSIAISDDGGYALVLDAATGLQHDVRLRTLDARLQQTGDESVASFDRIALADFRVANVPGRGVVIAGTDRLSPAIIRAGEQGRIATREAADSQPALRQLVIVSGGDVYIARTLIPAATNGNCMRAIVTKQ